MNYARKVQTQAPKLYASIVAATHKAGVPENTADRLIQKVGEFVNDRGGVR